MPLYDCGDQDCMECGGAFGPGRSIAVERSRRREEAYAALETPRITPKLLYGINHRVRSIEEAERDIAGELAKWQRKPR